jgi:Ca2+-transporting ATPase
MEIDSIKQKKVNEKWHTLSTKDVLSKLNSAENGLTQTMVEDRHTIFGYNELIERGIKSPWAILWEQLTALMVVILIIAAVISGVLGDYKDAIAIMAIVVLNALLGFTQEYRAEKAMAALRKMSVPVVKVRRDGHVIEISARDLVPGDIVLLEAGGFVPADGRLSESVNLRVQEAALTGESEPVEKYVEPLVQADLPLGDRRNMVYMGTTITYGRGTAIVTGTGMNTELGRIAEMIQSVVREPTPLQRRLEQLGRGLALAAIVIVGVVFGLGLLRGEDLRLMFLTAIGMAVAAVPEGLPAVVTIALALGAQRMLKRRALIRKLPAVETLGSVDTICSDKTGTLTENRMTVTILDVLGQTQSVETLLHRGTPVLDAEIKPTEKPHVRSLGLLLKAAALCNDAVLEHEDNRLTTVGDPTEGALVIAAAQLGLEKNELEKRWPRVAEMPFSSERKRMSTIHRVAVTADQTDAPWRDAPYVMFCKGAIDVMLDITNQIWSGDQAIPLNDELRQRILDANQSLAGDGQRVLGVAFRPLAKLPEKIDEEALERELIFIGLIGMIDPPRPEVKASVQTCRTAGIRPVMITGDHPLTAQYIARELGIDANGRVITGQELSSMTDEELEAVVESVSVYARVSPEHKLRIVQALQDKGHIVSMTGDGVNDAPALKKADIGVAMGITGTDVSKEASDMVLLDDNFATIVAAVEEGRIIYDNIRKFIKYTMTSNSGEIWTMLVAPFLGMPLPLLPLQILWVNLVTDGLPGLALTVEPAERDIMQRSPYHPKENIFGRGMGRHILWVGLLMGLVSLAMGLWFWNAGNPAWQTMVFTTLTLSQMGHAMAIRSGRESLFTSGLLSNVPLLGAVLLTFGLQMAVVYLPFLQAIFGTVALSLSELSISLVMSTIVFWGVELEKWWLRRKVI